MKKLHNKIKKLTPEQRDKLLQRIQLASRVQYNADASAIVSHSKDNYPLSFAQQRLWFFEQMHGQSATYNIPFAIKLNGVLNIAALEQAINSVIARHAVLRTHIVTADNIPYQAIQKSILLPLECINISHSELADYVKAEANLPFDIQHAPLLRMKLLSLAEDEHVFLLTMHHIISDGWSMGVFVNDLTVFYNAYIKQVQPILRSLPVQYGDFALWQQQAMTGAYLDKLMSFWQKKLDNLPEYTSLITDKPRPHMQSYHGETLFFTFTDELRSAVITLSQQENVSLYMLLLAVFYILIAKYTGKVDIPLATTVANRNHCTTEPLIGLFVNTLIVREQLDREVTFKQFLTKVRRNMLAVYEHQDLPFELLVKKLCPKRNLSYAPMAQLMFQLQTLAVEDIKLEGVSTCLLPEQPSTSKFDLTFSVDVSSQHLTGTIEYDTELFFPDTVKKLLSHYMFLLQKVVDDPERFILDYSLSNREDDCNRMMQLPHDSKQEVIFVIE